MKKPTELLLSFDLDEAKTMHDLADKLHTLSTRRDFLEKAHGKRENAYLSIDVSLSHYGIDLNLVVHFDEEDVQAQEIALCYEDCYEHNFL